MTAAFDDGPCHGLVLVCLVTSYTFIQKSNSWNNQMNLQVVEFVGQLDNGFPRLFVVKCSDNPNCPLKRVSGKFGNRIRGLQRLKPTQRKYMLVEGSDLSIEIHKHSRRREMDSYERPPEEDPMGKASIKFNDLGKHLDSEIRIETKENFKVEFDNPIQGLQLWLVIEDHNIDLNTLDPQIKNAMVELNELHSALSRLGSTSDGVGMFMELGKTISGLYSAANIVYACVKIVYNKHIKGQEEAHIAIQSLADSIAGLADQLKRLKGVPTSDELCGTVKRFPVLMEKVVIFIQKWLKSWMFRHIFVDSQKEGAIELREELDTFKDEFDRSLNIEMRIAQAKAADEKKLDDLLHSTAKPSLRDPCMEGTRNDILDKIESELKRVDGPNVIWIRGSPGVGKSALAASIAIRLQEQNRQVICFRFDRAESSTITTDSLWRVVAHDFAHLYPSVCRHILEDNKRPVSSDIDRIFEWLIKRPLSTLGDVPREELPVIVIDALDECGGLRHDFAGRRDYKSLLRTLKHWVEVDHLKKFRLVITSRPDKNIDQILPESISTRVNIPSGTDVKPGDGASDDIRVFLTSKLSGMGMEEAWVKKALDCLVPRAAGMFIWATTVADFLQTLPAKRFLTLQTKSSKNDGGRFKDLYYLYFTVVKTSFGGLEEEEIKGVTSAMGAMIFAKRPLNDDALMMLPGVGSRDMLRLIREGLASVIESGPVLRFHHRSFEDFLLSRFFLRELPKLSVVQDRNLHERQLVVLCLNTMVSSELHFNMCGLDSSSIRNVDIPSTVKSTIPPSVSYSCQFWTDHLVHTPSEDQFMEAVKFVMHEKLLFWMEVMSVLGKAHEMFRILTQALAWPGMETFDPGNELTSFIKVKGIMDWLMP